MRHIVEASLVVGLCVGVGLGGCSSDESGSGSASGSQTGTTSDASGTSGTTGTGMGGGGQGGNGQGGGGCVEAWLCSPWETDGTSDQATRICVDTQACGTTVNKPTETATLPALDFDYYKCKVEPIFDRGCAQLACHGTEEGRALRIYARGRLRITGETWIEPGCLKQGTPLQSETCIGSIECACWTLPHSDSEWQRNFDAARGFALDAAGAPLPAGMESSSDLVAQPVFGGKAHAGVHLFHTDDPDYTTLVSWLGGATLGQTCTSDN